MPVAFENRFFSVGTAESGERGLGPRELVITHKAGGGRIYITSKRSGELILTTAHGALLNVSVNLGNEGQEPPTIKMRVAG